MRPILILLLACTSALATPPRPLANHPGNIFVEGEAVVLPPTTKPYQVFAYEGKEVRALGKLPVGYYEARREGGGRVTIGVIAPLTAATPATSPIAIDVAMAWFYKDEAQQRAAANLCTLAGVNWVRDRLNWAEMEPKPGEFAKQNIYDDTARIQTEAGLRVLQVNHIAPPWAGGDAKHFPSDLRDVHRFYREMAARWKAQVLAFEPWNEADIEMFGGHTGSEMATLQKAAYLGLKAGNPDVIACQNVFAVARGATLEDFGDNDASAYFDTYNLHHYVGLEKYPAIYAAHRAVSAGKPMWVTECNIPVQWSGDAKLKEPSDELLRAQSRRVAKIFAESLYEGSVNTFYFMLPDYTEGQTQYGILHEDLTPRPAFVALAAVGRLLADAKPIGRWKQDDEQVHGYLFRARPDGKEKLVLVAWCDKGAADVRLNQPVELVADHLGRPSKGSWVGQLHLSSAPSFAVLPIDMKLPVDPPPEKSEVKHGVASPIVLQAIVPKERRLTDKSAYAIEQETRYEFPLFAYNFGDAAVKGSVAAKCPHGWHGRVAGAPVEIAPGERKELPPLVVNAHQAEVGTVGAIRVTGDFSGEDKPVLSLRFAVK